jgi:hypothetical protein
MGPTCTGNGREGASPAFAAAKAGLETLPLNCDGDLEVA